MNNTPVAYEGKQPYIFISYAHKDSDKVLPAIQGLQDAGYPVWYDAGIQVGSEWTEYIATHLSHSALVIAFISESSVKSEYCKQEITFSQKNKKPMISVILDETPLPPGLDLQLCNSQSFIAHGYPSVDAYVSALCELPYLSQIISEKEAEESIPEPIPYDGDRPYIYVNYDPKDYRKVMPAIQGLQDVGYPVWFNTENKEGSEWLHHVVEHLNNCALFISFISADAIDNQYFRREISIAVDKNKTVLTVRLDDSKLPQGLEMQLCNYQTLLAFKHHTTASFVKELVRAPFVAECLGMKPPVFNDEPKHTPKSQSDNTANSVSSKVTTSFKAISHKVEDAFNHFNDTADDTSHYTKKDIADNKVIAFLSYIGILVLIPIFAGKDSKFARFHANQGLALLITYCALAIGSTILTIISRGILDFISSIVYIAYLVYVIIGIVNVVKGKAKELPIIGSFKILK